MLIPNRPCEIESIVTAIRAANGGGTVSTAQVANSWMRLVAAASLALLGVLSIHLFLVAGVLAAVLPFTYTVAANDKLAYLKRLVPALLLTVGTTLGASAYWVIPVLIGRGIEGSVIGAIGAGDLAAYSTVPDQHLGLLPNLLGLYGFWAEGTGRFTSMKEFAPVWPVVLGLLLLVCAIGAIAAFRRSRDQIAPWVTALLACGTVRRPYVKGEVLAC